MRSLPEENKKVETTREGRSPRTRKKSIIPILDGMLSSRTSPKSTPTKQGRKLRILPKRPPALQFDETEEAEFVREVKRRGSLSNL